MAFQTDFPSRGVFPLTAAQRVTCNCKYPGAELRTIAKLPRLLIYRQRYFLAEVFTQIRVTQPSLLKKEISCGLKVINSSVNDASFGDLRKCSVVISSRRGRGCGSGGVVMIPELLVAPTSRGLSWEVLSNETPKRRANDAIRQSNTYDSEPCAIVIALI